MIIIYGGAFFLVIVIAIFSALVLGGIKITIINALIALVVAAFLTYRVTNYRKDIEKDALCLILWNILFLTLTFKNSRSNTNYNISTA